MGLGKPYAGLEELDGWADRVMRSRAPDFIIGEVTNPYMRRWWIIPRNRLMNVYLHEVLRSDDDRALHDHPWDNTSLLIRGSYLEITPEGKLIREPGDVIHRQATDAHRLVVEDGEPVRSLFMTGPNVREWGFHCPQGWRHWRDFVGVSAEGTSVVGRGCGE